jgi:secondary thiamine-phosphate synthase enzyme
MIEQYQIKAPPHPIGFHLITDLVLEQIGELPENGVLHLHIKHTSAGLTINENADPSVRVDMNEAFNHMVKENESYYTHTFEGSDDMPAHIKTSLVGNSISLPITNGQLNLGTWQGIYLCEFRDHGGSRKLVATLLS